MFLTAEEHFTCSIHVFYETRDVYVCTCLCTHVCVAGTCLTVAVFITQSTRGEAWLMLMSRTVLLKRIANNLGITSGSLNNHKNSGITSECQAQLRMKSYQSAARRKPRVTPWDVFFPISPHARAAFSEQNPRVRCGLGFVLCVCRRNWHQKLGKAPRSSSWQRAVRRGTGRCVGTIQVSKHKTCD